MAAKPASPVCSEQEGFLFRMSSDLAQAAEAYASMNWWVFPLKPKDKLPITPHGVKDASNKLDTVRRWWSKWPEANIGLDCGRSQIVVIDLDKRTNHDGHAEWAALVNRYGLQPCTSTSRTGGGGLHLLFAAPPRSEE